MRGRWPLERRFLANRGLTQFARAVFLTNGRDGGDEFFSFFKSGLGDIPRKIMGKGAKSNAQWAPSVPVEAEPAQKAG
jgi:hypothetical protein